MAKLPRVDSVGLRMAKSAGAERVSSVVLVSKSDPSSAVSVEREWSKNNLRGESRCACDNARDCIKLHTT